jgi:hypothetical protein
MPDSITITLPRLDGEHAKAHAALVAYATLGPGRSLDKLVETWVGEACPPTRRRATLADWSIRFDWQERVAAYDDALATAQLQQQQAAWVERAAELRERAWVAASAGLERCVELLTRSAIETTTTEETVMDPDTGRRMRLVIIRESPRGSLGDVARLLNAAATVGRLVVGEHTSHERLDVHVQLRSPEELEQMTTEEKRAYLADLMKAKSARSGL